MFFIGLPCETRGGLPLATSAMYVISVSPEATASLFIYTKSTNSNGPLDTPDSGISSVHVSISAEFEMCGLSLLH